MLLLSFSLWCDRSQNIARSMVSFDGLMNIDYDHVYAYTHSHNTFEAFVAKSYFVFLPLLHQPKPNRPAVSLRYSPADVDNLYGKLRAFTIHISNSMITSSINKITNGWTIKLNTHTLCISYCWRAVSLSVARFVFLILFEVETFINIVSLFSVYSQAIYAWLLS